ncbi:HAD family phosphatase [Cyanobacterium stanieri LEGE 03274]|uniref:HAD family phosphatase n=1 Tax=Cyanobacterium stanieri LEGE 03274 TaxID=1828756 RepID=A0ABR9V3C3_9CHRO|nr:Cof-type HAD-IIB family hydrolase [Cyanobacterium stanieri]MBE9221631.1 HAD family phosphatase [Cyanobacterium stanieri LEGE 03274]
MENIKLLFLDIDGTIAGASNQVKPEVIEAIKKVQARGVKVGLATGRMYCSAYRFHQEIGADLPIISYNGAWIQNPFNGEIISHRPLDNTIALELLDYLRSHEVEIHIYFNDQLYVDKVTEKTDSYIERSGITVNVVENLSHLLSQSPTKLLALSPDSSLIRALLDDLKQRYSNGNLYLTQSNPVYLEATSANVHKGDALKYVTEKILGLSASQVMAIGDNFNDYTMIEYAQIGVAMGDAPEQLKAIATYTTDNVENNGVAHIISQLKF